ncbi:MAG: hypothetical protein V1707_01235 [bacterium]
MIRTESPRQLSSSQEKQRLEEHEFKTVRKLQAKKEKLVEKLHELAELLDENKKEAAIKKFKEIAEERRLLDQKYHEVNTDYSNQDIAADSLWGIADIPKPDADQKIFRKQLKQSALAWSKKIIRNHYNEQLRQEASLPYFDRSFQQAGFVAEVLTESLATRLSGFPDAVIKIRPGNELEDQRQKIDFVVEVNDKQKNIRTIGVQLTVDQRTETIERKLNQLRKVKIEKSNELNVENIQLVILDIRDVMEAFNSWKQKKYPGGGPEQLLSQQTMAYIVQELFESLLNKSSYDNLQRYAIKKLPTKK